MPIQPECAVLPNLLVVNEMTLSNRTDWFNSSLSGYGVTDDERRWFSNIDGILDFFSARGLAEPGSWTSIVDSNILLAIVQGAAWSAGCKPRLLTPGAADWSVFFDVARSGADPNAAFGTEAYLRLAAIWGRAEQAATDAGVKFAAEFFNNQPSNKEHTLLIEFGDYYRSVVADPSLLRENPKIKAELQLLCVAHTILVDKCVDASFSTIESMKLFDPRNGERVGWVAGLLWDTGWEGLVKLVVPN